MLPVINMDAEESFLVAFRKITETEKEIKERKNRF